MAQIYCLIMVTNQVVNILQQQQLQLSNNWLYHIKMRYFNNHIYKINEQQAQITLNLILEIIIWIN